MRPLSLVVDALSLLSIDTPTNNGFVLWYEGRLIEGVNMKQNYYPSGVSRWCRFDCISNSLLVKWWMTWHSDPQSMSLHLQQLLQADGLLLSSSKCQQSIRSAIFDKREQFSNHTQYVLAGEITTVKHLIDPDPHIPIEPLKCCLYSGISWSELVAHWS